MDLKEYFHVQYGQRLLTLLQKFPPKQGEHLHPSIRLLEKKKQNQIMQKALQTERQEFKIAVEGLALRWEELHSQEAELQDNILTFQDFIVDNEQKRLRAVKRFMKERAIYNQKELELSVLQQECEELSRRRAKIQAQIQRYSKFYTYLERVVEASEEFQEVRDVVCRFHTLVATSSYLQEAALEAQGVLQQTKERLSYILKDKDDSVLQLNNQLGQLQTCLEHAQNQSLLWESRWAHIQNTAAKKTLLLGTIKMATLNLFQDIRELSKESEIVSVDDTIRQLEMIQQHLQDLAAIDQDVSRKEAGN